MLTPLDGNGGVDHARFARHARWLLAQGVQGVAPFGTTGEGPSFSMAERAAGLGALLASGIPADRVVAATGCTALAETIALTRQGVQSGCAACLVLPPFFFNDVPEQGLFAWYARVIEAVADPRLRVLLYHIPQVTGVPISLDLVEQLAAAFPGTIAGVKDSAGDWAHTSALLERVPQLAILVGHEPHLPRLLRAGGAGTICGVANVFPALVRALLAPGVTAADEERIATFIEIAFRQPFLPAFKAIVAARTSDPAWLALCPPQMALDEGARRALLAALNAAGLPIAPHAGADQ
jgi:4-hydroxy-tetrahydrodipicolinate synthase